MFPGKFFILTESQVLDILVLFQPSERGWPQEKGSKKLFGPAWISHWPGDEQKSVDVHTCGVLCFFQIERNTNLKDQ